MAGTTESAQDATPWGRRWMLVTGYHADHPIYEQVTRPSFYPIILTSDASPGETVDLLFAEAAYSRRVDPDRGAGDPTARVDLVRISALTDAGSWAGHDIWLTWQETTQTWEYVEDPRDRGIIDAGPHVAPELWTLQRELVATVVFDPTVLVRLAQAMPDVGIDPTDGLALIDVGDPAMADTTDPAERGTPADPSWLLATGYQAHDASYEQVTRPGIYPYTLSSDASPGQGVDLHHASAAQFRRVDPDRGPGDPTVRVDLVRISALTEAGSWAGHDTWLTWQETTKTWEHADKPRHIDPGPHVAPESWTLQRELDVIEEFDYDSVEPLTHEPPDVGIDPADGLDLE